MSFVNTVIVISLLVALAALLLGFVVVYGRLIKRVRQQKERCAVERKRQKLADQRTNIGNRIFNALCKAALDNPTGKVCVEKIEQSGVGYVILVRKDLPGYARHLQPCFETHVRLSTEGDIKVRWGAHGPEEFRSAEEWSLRELLEALKEKARNF